MSNKKATKKKAPVQDVIVEETKEVVKPLTDQQARDLEGITSISGKIRYLDSHGFSRGDIAKLVGKRYQHVRNVLETPLKRKA